MNVTNYKLQIASPIGAVAAIFLSFSLGIRNRQMAQLTSLSNVEESMLSRKTTTFPPTVWAGNFVARNPSPRKFIYYSFPYTTSSGFPGKSLKFGQRSGHSLGGVTKFRFHLKNIYAFHAGCKPLRAQI